MTRRILSICLVILLVICAVGCNKDTGPTASEIAEAQRVAAEAKAKQEADKAAAKVEVIADPEQQLEDQIFLNELEQIGSDLLLPMAFKVPQKVATNTIPTLYVGANYNIAPNDRWVVRTGVDSLYLYHDSGIAVQLLVVKTNAKFVAADIQSELKALHGSFIEKTDPFYQEAFLGTTLSGYELSFAITHDGREMKIIAGSVEKSKEVLVWTVNYFTDIQSEATAREIISALFSTLKNKNDRVILK